MSLIIVIVIALNIISCCFKHVLAMSLMLD